ncbi:MAG: HEAT repeat domain-containing protein [Nitrososphaerota archaeon]
MGGIFTLRSIMVKPIHERVSQCYTILKEDGDMSLRVEALWVLADSFAEIPSSDPLRDEIGRILEGTLANDPSAIVKHEACYVIGENNLRKQIRSLQNAALNDPSELVRHESVEALGLLQDFGSEMILKKAMSDPSVVVRETAEVVLKQLERAKSTN